MIALSRNAPARRAGLARRRAGFTLVEVLATLLLMAIALPAVMKGISLATQLGSESRRRIDASALGETKLADIVANNQWQLTPALAGDFRSRDYTWDMTLNSWAGDTIGNMQQIDLRVLWKARGQQQSMTFSTLVYVRGTQ